MKMSEMETIWFLKIINIYHLEIRILTCMVFGILYFSLKIWNRWKWIKVTDILLYSYFYFYWKSKDSFWVISDPNNTVSWLINACYTITYDSDCSIWQYLYLALSSSHHSNPPFFQVGLSSKLITVITCMTLDKSFHLCGLQFLHVRVNRNGCILLSLK